MYCNPFFRQQDRQSMDETRELREQKGPFFQGEKKNKSDMRCNKIGKLRLGHDVSPGLGSQKEHT